MAAGGGRSELGSPGGADRAVKIDGNLRVSGDAESSIDHERVRRRRHDESGRTLAVTALGA